jgi:hypothetical protein
MADILVFERTGWELVLDGVSEAALERLRRHARQVVALAHGRYTAELPPEPPDAFLQTLSSDGVHVISLNPIRDSLEAYFVRQVASAEARDTSTL